MPTKPLPSSRTNDMKSAFCSSVSGSSPVVLQNTTASYCTRFFRIGLSRFLVSHSESVRISAS